MVLPRYKLEDLGRVSMFIVKGQYTRRITGEPAKCQIEDCRIEANWIQNLKGGKKSIFVCWKHHEEATDLRLRGRS